MAEKKSWRDYYKNSSTEDKASTEKTGTWRDYMGDKSTTGKTASGSWRNHIEYDPAAIVGNNVANRVNSWLQNHNSYITDYQKRYEGRKGTLEDAYVSDSADWLNAITQRKAANDAEAEAIIAYIEQNKDYLDLGWVNRLSDTIANARKQQSAVIDSSAKDNEFWNSFNNEELVKQYGSAEEAYKYYQRNDGYSKKYTGMTYEDIWNNLNNLEEGEERDWLINNQANIYGDTLRGSADFQDYANKGATLSYTDFGTETRHRGKSRRMRSTTSIDKYRAASMALYEHYGNEKPENAYKSQYNEQIDIYRTMTDEEFNTLAYCIAKDKEQGTNLAERYVDSLEGTLKTRRGTDIGNAVKDIPVIADLYGVVAGLDQFATGLEALVTDKDYYVASPYQVASGVIRDSMADDGPQLPEWLGGASLRQGLYDFTTTTSNMAPSILASAAVGALNPVAGTVVGNTLMGASAAGNAYSDAINRGFDKSEARFYSTAIGASEAVLGAALGGISKLGGVGTKLSKALSGIDNGLLRFSLQYGGKIASEGIEEGLQEILDPILQNAILGADEDINWSEVAYSALLGGLSAGVLELGGTISQTRGEQALKKQYGGNTDALIQEGLESDITSESYDLATQYKAKTDSGKSLTGAEIRQLLAANKEQVTPKDMKKIQQAAEKRLTELGQTEDVSKLAELATRYATGQNLSKAEKNFLASSKYGSRVYNELLPKNIDSEGFSTEWAEEIGTNQVNAAQYNKKAIRTLLDAMASMEDPNAYKPLESRVEADEPVKVSDTGKAVIRGTDEEIDLTSPTFKQITDDGVVLDVNGKTVHSSEIDYGSDDQGLAINSISKIEHITPAAASALYAKLDMGKSVMKQLNGMDEAFTYGFYNYSEADLEAGNFVGNLTQEQKTDAYKLGQYVRGQSDVDSDADIVKMRTAAEAKQTEEQKTAKKNARFDSKDVEVYFEDGGTVVKFDEHTGKYDEKRMAAVNYAKLLSKMGIGGKYYFFESDVNSYGVRVYKDANGNEVEAPNGMYKASDGSIHIDLNAGNQGQGTALFTLGHELTHFIKQWSKQKFKVLADFLIEEYGKTDVSMRERVLEKQSFLEEKRGEKVSYDEAFEEVVADAMSTMLSDGNLHEKLAKLKATDTGLFNKIKQFFEKLIAKFQELYKDLTPEQQAARDVRAMKDAFDNIQQAFAEALVEASDNFRASEQVLAEAGIAVNAETDSGSLLSVRDVLNDKERKKVANALAERFDVTEKEAMDWLKAETSLASIILNPKYSAFLDYEADPNEVAIKQNSDYPQGTVDFSNICKKRREFTQVMNRILRNFPNHVFAATDLAKIRTIMGEEGMTLPCGICYVEDRRQLDSIVAQDFIDGLKLYREGSKTRPDGKPFNANQLKGLQLTDGDTYVPTIYELVTLEGRNSLKEKNPNMEAAWVKYNNARGMQAVRLLTNEAEYKRQILKYTPKTVQTKNDYGGLRIYSFSDAEMFHLIDIIQVLTDCAAVGLKVQGYTKVNEYARAVKDTGEKLNRSLIPLGDLGYHMENGKVVLDYDPVEGIDINSEDFFDSKDNPDVGNIVIGINPTQIRAAMVSSFIDYIIPFHTGQSAEVLGEKGIAAWVNYKDSQSEIDLATGKKSAHQINIYTEVFQAAEDDGKPIRNKRDFVEKFLAVCKENGLKPRFAEFLNMDANGDYVYTEGYHKFLVDFKTFAQTEVGEYLPQNPVKPIFDNGYITGLLETYVKEQQVKDAEVAEQMPKVIERITNEIVKPMQDGVKKSDRSVKTFKKDQNANGVFVANALIDLAETDSKWWTGRYNHDILSMSKSDDTEFRQFHQEVEKRTRDMEDYGEQKQTVDDSFTIQDGKGKEFIYRVKLDGYMHGVVLEKIDKAKYAAAFLRQTKGGTYGKSVTNIKGRTRNARSGIGRNHSSGGGNRASNGNPGHGGLGSGSSQGNHAGTNSAGKPANRTVPAVIKKSDRDGNTMSDRAREILANARPKMIGKNEKASVEFDTVRELFNELNSDKDIQALADKVFEVAKEDVYGHYGYASYPGEPKSHLRLPVAFVGKDGIPDGVHGQFRKNTIWGDIIFSYEYFMDEDVTPQSKASTILHEVIHAVTCSYIENAYSLSKARLGQWASPIDLTDFKDVDERIKAGIELVDVFEQVKYAPTESGKQLYGQLTAYEMVAEMANVEFRNFLKKQNLWNRIVDAIKRIFGIPRTTAYDAVSDALERILVSTKNDADAWMAKGASAARYSERGDGTSNRSLLANAFEGITQNSNEYKLIQEYKGRIRLLNEQEEKLSKLNAEIRKIRFGKSEYDAKKLRELEAEAKNVAQSINRQDKKLLSLEASEPLRKVIERERKKEAQKTKDHVKEIQQNKKVRAEQTELRHKIRKAVRDLDKILNRGNKKLNVKEDMQNVVTKALKAADILFTDNYGNYDMLRNGIGADMSDAEEALVATCAKMLKDLDKMPTDGYDNWQARQEAENRLKTKMSGLKDVFARERKRLNNTTVSSILGELADAYASLEKSEQSYVQGAYSEAVHNFLKNLQSEVGGTIVNDMTKDQLESLYAAYKMVLNTVRNANKMFNEELKQSREQLGNAVIQEVMRAGGVHLLGTKVGDAISQADWNNMKPIWVANRLGSDTFGELMKSLFKGQYNFAVDIDEAKQFKLGMDEKYHPRNWDAEKLYEFESSTGKKFSLNLQQIMSLYAFSKRDQAYSHLLNGGFVFEDNSTVIVEKNGIKRTYIHKGAASYKLNEATLNGIINSLTAEQKSYVDDMQAYLSDVMGAKGNEVSMKLYGIQMFKEKFYFPLRSSGAYMEKAKEAEMKKEQGQINLVNSGFTHAVKPEAKNPIILSNFMDVWAEHCNEMSMYHSMVLPMEDFRKVYNYSTIHDERFESASVYQTIQDAYGKAATGYIDQLYRELNAGATVDPRETTLKKLVSNFKKTAVMLSASVVVQQFSSIGRAYAVIDPKYFIGTKVNSGTQLSAAEEMKKYAPVAIIKEMGGFDTGTKGSAKSYIMAEKYGKGERIQGLVKDEQYRSDIMGYLPAKADEKTWCAIWEAAKRETKVKHPNMDVKSEEFLKLAGERFSEVIEKTQVYDSVLARSANMRSKTGLMQMATAFLAEPTTTVNLLEDAIRRGNKKYMARAFGAVAVSIILNNALASIVYAMRDDDEDETFIEKYFQSFTSGMIDDINPMTYYPFLKDVWSLFQGYDVERTDMSVIADVRDALKKTVSLLGKDTSNMDDDALAEHNKAINSAILSLLDAGCSVFGVPFKNVRREANGIINTFNTVGKDLSGERTTTWNTFWDKVGSAVKDTIPVYAWTKDKSKGDKLYDAIMLGDKAYLIRLKSTYKIEDAYKSAVRTALRENDSRIHAAAQARYEGNIDECKRIYQEIKKEGKFDPNDIMDAIYSEEAKIRNELKPETETSDYSATDFVNAVIYGETGMAQAMRDDIIRFKVANGKTQEEAEDAFIDSVKTSTRNAYDSNLLDEAGTEKMLLEYAGMDEEEAAAKVDYWAFIKAHPQYRGDFSQSNVEKYHEFAEPANISLEVYAQFVNGTKGLETKYDQWGDVDVSKREQVLEVIDSLPLTWQQKDALYLAAGYSENTIWDVPW